MGLNGGSGFKICSCSTSDLAIYQSLFACVEWHLADDGPVLLEKTCQLSNPSGGSEKNLPAWDLTKQ